MRKGFAYTATIAIIAFATLAMVIYSNTLVVKENFSFRMAEKIPETKRTAENIRILLDKAVAEALGDYVVDRNEKGAPCENNLTNASNWVRDYIDNIMRSIFSSERAGAIVCEYTNYNFNGDAAGNASISIEINCMLRIKTRIEEAGNIVEKTLFEINYNEPFIFEKRVSATWNTALQQCEVSVIDAQSGITELTLS